MMPKNPSNAKQAQAIKAVRDEYLSALMLSGSNRDKYSPLCMDLKNQFGFGEDCYPKSIDQCLSLLNQWGHTLTPASANPPCTPWGSQTPPPDPKPDEALVFMQGSSSKKFYAKDSKEISSKSSKSSKVSHHIMNLQCKNCGQLGHTSLECPMLTQSKAPPAQIHAMADINYDS